MAIPVELLRRKIKEHSQSALAGARLAGQSNDGSKKVILIIQSRQHPVRILGSLKHPILHVVNSSSIFDPTISDGIEV